MQKPALNSYLVLLIQSVLITLLTLSCQSPRQTTDRDSFAQCSALATRAPDGVLVQSSGTVTDRADLPGYCAINGTIDPDIEFEARFPLVGWNGKYYQSGCGGYCGRVLPDKKGYSNTINPALALGYATITTNNGHDAGNGDASWARGNPQAVTVYAHSGIPLTYQAGLQMVETFYGQPSKRQYFGGCSNGGRMAAMAAQRYPELFDGILGGGAVINLSQNGGIYGSWVVQVNTGPDGQRILNRANFAHKLPALEQAVVEQCDSSDGRTDGFITLPRKCVVDVAALPSCSGTDSDHCFTESERGVLEKWYRGPHNSEGQQLYPGMPAGSERYWFLWFLDGDNRIAPGNALGGDYARYLGFEDEVADDYTAMDFDFDRDPVRLEANGRQLNALDPDLAEFRDAGGKYLMWHGWQDPLVLPDQSVAYYESVVNEMGGADEVGKFFRLFMIPGQGHCWEIPSARPDRFDPITILDQWVETGEAPAQLTAHALEPESADTPATAICPYPAPPRYLDDNSDLQAAYCQAEP